MTGGPAVSTSSIKPLHYRFSHTFPSTPFSSSQTWRRSECLFGSSALQDHFRCNPGAIELSRHDGGLHGAEDDFRDVFYNVNGLDGFNHIELLALISSASVNCIIVLTPDFRSINCSIICEKLEPN